jgi:hypothetical protein
MASSASSPPSPRSTPSRLAVAVGEDYESFSTDWPYLRRELEAVGIVASLERWTDAAVRWDTFDLILANGAWDNIHHPDEFPDWADRVAGVTRLVNSASMLRWNIDKHYLAVLAEAGIPTLPTTWIEPPGDWVGTPLPDGEFVVKPAVSGGGFETARYAPDELDAARLHIDRLLAAGRTAMVQPYQSAVDALGEVGLIFLAGQYSHAIAKSPLLVPGAGAKLNLAIDEEISATTPSHQQQDVATAALTVAEQLLGATTYARIDLVPQLDGTPALLELELLDPALFLDFDPAAAARFAQVLKERMAGS